MTILLIDLPSGEQREIHVKQGGGYYDPSAVIWDERTDGTLPAITLGGMVRSGDTLVFNQARKDQHDAAVQAATDAENNARVKQELTALALEALPDFIKHMAATAPQALKDKAAEIAAKQAEVK